MTLSETQLRIKEILDSNTSYAAYRKAIKTNFPEIDSQLASASYSYAEALHRFMNDITQTPCCPCGIEMKYVDRSIGYRKFCSTKCAANCDEVRQKKSDAVIGKDDPYNSQQRRQTMMRLYGVEHANQHPDFMSKTIDKLKSRTPDQKKQSVKKRFATCMERYGNSNIWDVPEIRQKAIMSNRTKYGVDWSQQNESIRNKRVSSVRDIYYKRLLDRYEGVNLVSTREDYKGINFYNGGDSYKWECLECLTQFVSKITNGEIDRCPNCFPSEGHSKGENELYEFIRSLTTTAKLHQRIIPPKEVDIFLPDHNIAIEYNGLYWHSDQKIDKNYHLDKTEACKKINIRLLHIFESEWEHQKEIVKSRLRCMFGKGQTIYARKCKVVEISKSQENEFLNFNHLQGSCVSKYRFGLVYDQQIVSVMTFGKNRFSDNADWELLRFATIHNTVVVGGASKLLNHFDKMFSKPSIVSYSDRRWNSGNLYRQLGFVHSHQSQPNYWYFRSENKLINRMHFQKHKLSNILENFDSALSEKENMRNHGFRRIYDCGTDVFVRP